MNSQKSLARSKNLGQAYGSAERAVLTTITGYLTQKIPSFGKDKRYYGNVYHSTTPQIFETELCFTDKRSPDDNVFSDLTNIKGDSREKIMKNMGFYGISLYNVSAPSYDETRGREIGTECAVNTFGGPERKINDTEHHIHRNQILYWDIPSNNEKIDSGKRITASLKPYDEEIMALSGDNVKEYIKQYVENDMNCVNDVVPVEMLLEQIYIFSSIVINSMVRSGIIEFKREDDMGVAPNDPIRPEKIYDYVKNNQFKQTEKFLKDLSMDNIKRKEYGEEFFINKSVIFTNLIFALKEFCPERKRIVGKALSDAKPGESYDYLLTQVAQNW